MTDETGSLIDPEAQAKAKKKAKTDEDRVQAGLRHLVGSPDGVHLLLCFLQHCGIYTSSFTGNSETFFREGRRDAGLWLIERLESVEPGLYAKLLASRR